MPNKGAVGNGTKGAWVYPVSAVIGDVVVVVLSLVGVLKLWGLGTAYRKFGRVGDEQSATFLSWVTLVVNEYGPSSKAVVTYLTFTCVR